MNVASRSEGWRWLAKLVVGGVALALWGYAGVLSSGPEQWPALALLQYVPFLVFLVPAVFAWLVSWALGWWWRGVATASVLLVLVYIMGLCWGHPDEGEGRIRVMTYNAKAFLASARAGGVSELALEVMQHDPDVLLMQDAGELVTSRNPEPEAFRTLVGDRTVQSFGQYIIASRLPLSNCRQGFINYDNKPHTYFRCVLTAHGRDIDLITVHFTTPRAGLNAARAEGLEGLDAWRDNMLDRLLQSGALAEQMRQMKRPRILTGDLNAPESSQVVRTLLHTGLRDAFSSSSWGYGYTYGQAFQKLGFSFLRIDHILVSDEIGVAQVYVGGGTASQHRPVIADLYVGGRTP